MQLFSKTVLAALFAVSLFACSPAVYVESSNNINLSQYKTFQWVQTSATQTGDQNTSAFGAEAVRNTVRTELQNRGLQEISNNPDLLVTYDILVEKGTERRSDPVYTQPMTRFFYNPFMRRWAPVYYPSQFAGYDTYSVPVREGTLTLTLLDAKTDKAVWQGWTTDRLDTRRFTTRDLEKNTRNILRKLR